jgi:hypothetical protein
MANRRLNVPDRYCASPDCGKLLVRHEQPELEKSHSWKKRKYCNNQCYGNDPESARAHNQAKYLIDNRRKILNKLDAIRPAANVGNKTLSARLLHSEIQTEQRQQQKVEHRRRAKVSVSRKQRLLIGGSIGLTDEQVRQILEYRASYHETAKVFGICARLVFDIKHNTAPMYQHVSRDGIDVYLPPVGRRKGCRMPNKSKPVLTPDDIFDNATVASFYYGIHSTTAQRHAKKQLHGWRYLTEDEIIKWKADSQALLCSAINSGVMPNS